MRHLAAFNVGYDLNPTVPFSGTVCTGPDLSAEAGDPTQTAHEKTSIWYTGAMAGFNEEQLAQLQTIIPTLDQIQAVVREEVTEQIETKIRPMIREEVRREVRSEVQSQLEPIHKKLDSFRKDAVDDTDALNETVQHHKERLDRIDRHLSLTPIKS